MKTPKIREFIKRKFDEDLEEAKSLCGEGGVFEYWFKDDKAWIKVKNDITDVETKLAELGYKPSRAKKVVGKNLPDNEWASGKKGHPVSNTFTMYVNKDKGNVLLRQQGFEHYAPGPTGYFTWDFYTVYKLNKED